MFGDFDYDALSAANRLLGWMWLFGFSWTAIIILLNFFVAILCEVYAQVMEEYEGIEHVSLLDSVVTKVKRLLVSSPARPLLAARCVVIARCEFWLFFNHVLPVTFLSILVTRC